MKHKTDTNNKIKKARFKKRICLGATLTYVARHCKLKISSLSN